MHSSDQSLIYPLLRVVNWFSGDYIAAYKMTAALLAGLLTWGMYQVAIRWSQSMYVALLIGSISLFSPHLTYFAAQYPKNLLGFVFLLWLIASLKERTSYSALVYWILNFFGHRLTFGLATIFALGWSIRNFLSIKKVIILLITGGFLFGLSFVIPGLPNLTDIQRFEGLLSSDIQWAPYSFIKTFGAEDRIAIPWLTEIIIASLVYFLSIPFLVQVEKRWLLWTLFGISSLLLFPFFTWDLTGMAYRFFLIYILLAPLFIPLLLKVNQDKITKVTLVFISLLLMLGSSYSYKSYQPAKHDAAYAKYAKLTEKSMEYLNPDSTALVIAHNALAEYFTFTTEIDALPWNPEYEILPTKLWRIATDIRQSEMGYYLSENELQQVHKIGIRYFLLPDYLWQKILQKATTAGDDFLLKKLNTWRNPHRIRPAFLLKKKKVD